MTYHNIAQPIDLPAGSMDAEFTTTFDHPGAQYFSANAYSTVQHIHIHTDKHMHRNNYDEKVDVN